MAVLERVTQMKQQGIPESQIIQSLKEEGISPKEINESLSQSKIKSEINSRKKEINSPENIFPNVPENTATPNNPQSNIPNDQQMQPSMMEPNNQQTNTPQGYPERIPNYETEQQTAPVATPSPYTQYGNTEYTADQGYPVYDPSGQGAYNYPEYQPQQIIDVETINDIAEQLIEEKTKELKKQISTFTKFKEEINLESERINKRLQNMEDSFNSLQIAILGKIGDQGQNIKDIAKEMHSTQESFSKILDPLTDNIRELQKITNPSESKTKSKTSKSKKSTKRESDFESYLR